MIILPSSTTKLRLVTSAAGTIHYHCAWVDTPVSAPVPSAGHGSITTAATTDIVAATGSSEKRNVKTINVRNADASVSNTVTVQVYDGTNAFDLFKCSLAPSEVLSYVEGIGWDIFASDGSHKAQAARMLAKVLSADDTGGSNGTSAQPWFPTAGGVTVEAATTYFFEGQLFTTRAAGTTSHTTGVLFGGTATLTSIDYRGGARTGDSNALAGFSMFRATAATSLVVKAASTNATEDTHIEVSGVVRINAAGTFIPQFVYSAAPGGAPTIKRGSFFRMWPIGDNNIQNLGTWA